MTDEEFENLGVGDILQSKTTGDYYPVEKDEDGNLVAVRRIENIKPDNWILVNKAE